MLYEKQKQRQKRQQMLCGQLKQQRMHYVRRKQMLYEKQIRIFREQQMRIFHEKQMRMQIFHETLI
jgi:hypothetical protein